MKTFLIFFVLFFSFPVFAGDISDFEIEGMSIGDSLLDYMSEKKIKTEMIRTRPMYNYLTEEFGEAYLNKKFETYDYLAIVVKNNDQHYNIHQVRGIIAYNDDISKCYIKKESIINEIASLFQDEKRNDKTIIYPKSIDPSGKSEMRRTDFYFNSGGKITIACANLDESVRKKNNWDSALSVTIQDTEANNWFSNY